jgi:hypothetical protein
MEMMLASNEDGMSQPQSISLIRRIFQCDYSRKTRVHTSNGYLCLNPFEILRAVGTSFNRVALKKYSRTPWLAYPAVDYLKRVVAGRRVFEFGSGMSTLWFAERCKEIVSVESNPVWHQSVSKMTTGLRNVRLILAGSKEEYLRALETGDRFDLILVDGLHREECVDLTRPHLTENGILIVDNTDIIPGMPERIKRLFGDSEITAFRGWAPGILHPNETTVVQHVASRPATTIKSSADDKWQRVCASLAGSGFESNRSG